MKLSVLIVDDEKITCKHLTRVFQKQGYETATANTGEEGLAILANSPVALLLVDLKMPGMDGFAVLKQVREGHPGLPVVVMTAHGNLQTAVKAMKLGASHYLTKPFSAEQILIIAERAMEREALKAEVAALKEEMARLKPGTTVRNSHE